MTPHYLSPLYESNQDNRDEEGNYLARSSWRKSLSRRLNIGELEEKARSGAARMFGAEGKQEELRRQDLDDTSTRLRFARIPRDQARAKTFPTP